MRKVTKESRKSEAGLHTCLHTLAGFSGQRSFSALQKSRTFVSQNINQKN